MSVFYTWKTLSTASCTSPWLKPPPNTQSVDLRYTVNVSRLFGSR